MVGLGEPLAETIRGATIGHQFPLTGKLTFLSVRSSFTVLEMSVELEGFCSTFSRQRMSNWHFAVQANVQSALFTVREVPAKRNNADLSQVYVHSIAHREEGGKSRPFVSN